MVKKEAYGAVGWFQWTAASKPERVAPTTQRQAAGREGKKMTKTYKMVESAFWARTDALSRCVKTLSQPTATATTALAGRYAKSFARLTHQRRSQMRSGWPEPRIRRSLENCHGSRRKQIRQACPAREGT